MTINFMYAINNYNQKLIYSLFQDFGSNINIVRVQNKLFDD